MATRRKRKRKRSDEGDEPVACPKCGSREIRLRGNKLRVLLSHLRRRYHYSCRRCMIYWSSRRYAAGIRPQRMDLWFLRRWSTQFGRLGCLIGLHEYGGLRRNPEGGRMRSCRRCNRHQKVAEKE